MISRTAALLGLTAAQIFAQADTSGETTRQLYYLATQPEDKLPPVTSQPTKQESTNTGAVHLGFRYNLVLISNGNSERVSADRVLQPGDCFSLELQANRSAYLYVLAKQSSGAWVPLLPSAQMPEETIVLAPKKRVLAPKNYCFEVRSPAGTENLFVVLSRDPKDFLELYEGIKAGDKGASNSKVSAAVERMNDRFASRDIAIRKLEQPRDSDEVRGSVYVVSTSDKPT